MVVAISSSTSHQLTDNVSAFAPRFLEKKSLVIFMIVIIFYITVIHPKCATSVLIYIYIYI
ncbi:hypothetical protein BCR42DRAFT_402684, partial [Absidia repens]